MRCDFKLQLNFIQRICYEIAAKGKQFHKDKLRWRSSKRSLGWVPFKPSQLAKRKGDRFRFGGKNFRLFEELPEGRLVSGSFAQDSLGDWCCCVSYEKPEALQADPCGQPAPDLVCGLDPGTKAAVTCSDGASLKIDAGRKAEKKVAKLQRRSHRKQAKRVHRKAKRVRQDSIGKYTTGLVEKYQNIYIGDVKRKFLIGRNRQKAVTDGALSTIIHCLLYKGKPPADR